MRKKIISKNKTKNLIYLNRKISLTDIKILNDCCHFDLVLALSVMHHLPGDHLSWIEQLYKLGDNVIIELALGDSKRTAIRQGYDIPPNSKILGYGDSHLEKNFKRPIILL